MNDSKNEAGFRIIIIIIIIIIIMVYCKAPTNEVLHLQYLHYK